jgi:lipoprotein-anchoring transpeptidase ErfK/SrfK
MQIFSRVMAMIARWRNGALGAALAATISGFSGMASGAPLAMVDPSHPADGIFEPVLRDQPSSDADALPAHLRRQVVGYASTERPGTVIVDTGSKYLYYVLGGGRAIRYGIGVGREGFTWAGVQTVSRKAEWPDWSPPPEMISRQAYLPRWVAGGPGNPLGARALYLGATQYRIHGTNAPSTIGQNVSSGCIRMTNEDVTDLYGRVTLGAKVVVLNNRRRSPAPEDYAARADARGMAAQQVPSRATLPTGNVPAPAPQTRSQNPFAFGLY